MKEFNVINFDFNQKKFTSYNILPYLISCYEKEQPKTFEETKKLIERKALYRWWSKCEYEIILVDWPCQDISEKWDVYRQVMMNIDVITNLVIDCVKNEKK